MPAGDAVLDVGVEREADPWDLVPTTSTTVCVVVGDALAIALMVARDFGPGDFRPTTRVGRWVPGCEPRRSTPARWGADMARGHVCVVGSFMMDLLVRAPRRPDPGETVIGTGFHMFLGGKGFNQAVAAARAGARTTMVGRLGDDDFGREFLDRLAGEGIDARHVVVDPVAGTGIGAPLVEDAARTRSWSSPGPTPR